MERWKARFAEVSAPHLAHAGEHLEREAVRPGQMCGTKLGKGSGNMRLWAKIEKAIPQSDGTLEIHGVVSSPIEDDQGENVLASAIAAALPRYMLYPTIRSQHFSDPIGKARWRSR